MSLRDLGLGAVFSLIASIALAQLNQKLPGPRNLACGSRVSLDDGWATAAPVTPAMGDAR